jgi:hypothetical protein
MPGLLLHSPSAIVQQLLIDLALGVEPSGEIAVSPDWQVFDHKEPNRPDKCITVFDEEGEDDGRTNPDNERQTRDGVSIKIRGLIEDAFLKANVISITLDSVSHRVVTIDATRYKIWTFIRKGQPRFAGDEPDRDLVSYTVNGLISVRKLN